MANNGSDAEPESESNVIHLNSQSGISIDVQTILKNCEDIIARNREKFSTTTDPSTTTTSTNTSNVFYKIEITQNKVENEATIQNVDNIVSSDLNSSRSVQNGDSRHCIIIRTNTSFNNLTITGNTMQMIELPSCSSANNCVTANEHLNLDNRKRKSFEDSVIIINGVGSSDPGSSKRIKLQPSTSNKRVKLTCPVCLIKGLRIPTSTPCGHIFCNKCIIRAHRIRKLCPLCKKKFKVHQLRKLYFT